MGRVKQADGTGREIASDRALGVANATKLEDTCQSSATGDGRLVARRAGRIGAAGRRSRMCHGLNWACAAHL